MSKALSKQLATIASYLNNSYAHPLSWSWSVPRLLQLKGSTWTKPRSTAVYTSARPAGCTAAGGSEAELHFRFLGSFIIYSTTHH